MKISIKRVIPYLIVLVPLVLVLSASFFITTFYLEKVTSYFDSAKEKSLKKNLEAKKVESEMWSSQLNLLFDYKFSRVEEGVKKELQARVDIAYKSAQYIYEKYKNKKSKNDIKERIIDALSHMKYGDSDNYIFITDYRGNSILLGNQNIKKKNLVSYMDADYRSIILEEIQMVRKRQEGFLKSTNAISNKKEIILVKSLEMYGWFIGTSMRIEEREIDVKERLLDMVKSIPIENRNFIAIYDNYKKIYLSTEAENKFTKKELLKLKKSLTKESVWHEKKIEGFQYYSTFYAPMKWNLIYGFDSSISAQKELLKYKNLEKLLDEEFDFVLKASLSIIFFVVVLSLLLSRKINAIFNSYQKEVEMKRSELQELNATLAYRVQEEITKHQKQEKMLIQQSKMAEMGDMLSMIAHQWRQPLNQISYIFMNIESAYEHKELHKEYLDLKIKEANSQLEFMSVTIDDFRNYFRPDTEKELSLVSELVQSSVSLMKSSLDSASIDVKIESRGVHKTVIYKNEFIQVLLNLIKNAKDATLISEVDNPSIIINAICNKNSVIVEVCDNGGGVKASIMEKIFEPYFTTKDKKNGTGLGLYMSKMIIEEHLNGKLSVSNRANGACFKIEINS